MIHMPRITIQLFEGRSIEQKRAAAAKITEAICETCAAKPQDVTIVFDEMKKENYAKAGVLYAD